MCGAGRNGRDGGGCHCSGVGTVVGAGAGDGGARTGGGEGGANRGWCDDDADPAGETLVGAAATMAARMLE